MQSTERERVYRARALYSPPGGEDYIVTDVLQGRREWAEEQRAAHADDGAARTWIEVATWSRESAPASPVPVGDEPTELERRLRRSLERYGQHEASCPSAGVSKLFAPCTCGYHAALAQIPAVPVGGDDLHDLLTGAAHHLRNLPGTRESDDIRWARRLEDAAEQLASSRAGGQT